MEYAWKRYEPIPNSMSLTPRTPLQAVILTVPDYISGYVFLGMNNDAHQIVHPHRMDTNFRSNEQTNLLSYELQDPTRI